MSHFEHRERISRQRAAERLADIAYALTAGEQLRIGGELVSVPAGDELMLEVKSNSTGDCRQLEVELSCPVASLRTAGREPVDERRP
jgi:amphi-Trp domain-containing protein